VILACNDRHAASRIVEHLPIPSDDPVTQLRILRMYGRGRPSPERLQRSRQWRRAEALVRGCDSDPLLNLQTRG
jgi:hypothetical protein